MLITEGGQFNSQTVFLTGRGFRNCTFMNCTLVFQGAPSFLEKCTIGPNIWRIELTFHSADDIAEFSNRVLPWMYRSLDPDSHSNIGSNGEDD